jgi:DNA-dependent RNA polymerase auxiliary subunit epsilon
MVKFVTFTPKNNYIEQYNYHFKEGVNTYDKVIFHFINSKNWTAYIAKYHNENTYWIWDCECDLYVPPIDSESYKSNNIRLSNPRCIWEDPNYYIDIIKQNGYAIKYITHQSDTLQLEAVKQNGEAIKYIDNPSEALQMEAVKKDAYNIRYIKDPPETVQLEVVKQKGHLIQYINNPYESVQLMAVENNPFNINHIENPTEAVKLVSVRHNRGRIYGKAVRNSLESTQLEAVQKEPESISFIKDPSETVQLAAFIDFIMVVLLITIMALVSQSLIILLNVLNFPQKLFKLQLLGVIKRA